MNLHHDLLTRAEDLSYMDSLKFDRISSYIKDQKSYTNLYRSPNHHTSSDDSSGEDNSSVVVIDPITAKPKVNTKSKKGSISQPEGEYHDDDFSLFSASVSQVIARKYQKEQQQHKMDLEPKSLTDEKGQKNHGVFTESHKTQLSPIAPSHYSHRKMSPISSSVHHDHQNNNLQRKKLSRSRTSGRSIQGDKRMKLPQSKAKGFHLLHKFVSPNLEVNRISMKSNGTHRQPKPGLFNKGKSSSKGTGAVPDLVFSESKFLEKIDSSVKDHISNSSASSNHFSCGAGRENQHFISKYFKPKVQQRKNDSQASQRNGYHESNQSLSNHHHPGYNSTRTRSTVTPRKEYVRSGSQDKQRSVHMAYANEGKVLTANKHSDSIKKNELSSTTKTSNIENVSVSSSSNETIEKILTECKAAPPVSSPDYLPTNYNQNHQLSKPHGELNHFNNNSAMKRRFSHFYPVNQVPSYSRVKTPTGNRGDNAFDNHTYKQQPNYQPIVIESSDDGSCQSCLLPSHRSSGRNNNYSNSDNHTATPTLSFPKSNGANSPQQRRFYQYEDEMEVDSDMQSSHQEYHYNSFRNIYNDNLLEDWQIENSIISFSEDEDESTRLGCMKSDVDSIISPRNNNSGKSYVESILNFWKNQYKRSL